MLEKLRVRNFKSLADVTVEFPRFAVLYGPNAAGKSNLLDAVSALSWLGTARTLSDALEGPEPVRGYALEAFSLPAGGLPELLERESATFSLEADLAVGKARYRYRVEPRIDVASGRLQVADEYLALIGTTGAVKKSPAPPIAKEDHHLRVRSTNRGRPREEPLGLNHTLLSDRSLAGAGYQRFEAVRRELSGWSTYYLQPNWMREPRPPADVTDLGRYGHFIAPFLYKLRAEEPERFNAVKRTLQTLAPGIETLEVRLDERQGTLDLVIRHEGIEYSSRVVSEGTLRLVALCVMAVNPWGGPLLSLEEPENGVHPRRLELIANLLLSLALEDRRQVVVTTHSPRFCNVVQQAAEDSPGQIGLFNVQRVGGETRVTALDTAGPLFTDEDIVKGLTAHAEDGQFERLARRGWIDG